ncbi:TonB-dependent receptor [Flavisolibacter ginsenosidimutans]
MLTQAANAQKKISGRVISSSDQQPVPNATVQIKGTRTATVTGSDGSFSLTTTEANPVLEISSVGFMEKSVSASNGMTVSLETDARSLSEVVVTGVGAATSKKRIAISVETVTPDKTTPVPSASVDQFLVGKVAGAQIQSTNGSPGAPTQILLRGINTLRGGTSPMILLDGIEIRATDLNSLDLNAIERVEIVQGAAAATQYGAQGANGVIQLFSKKGKQGRTSIDVSSSVSANSLLNIGKVHKAYFHSLQTNANNEVVGGSGNPLVFDPLLGTYTENVVWNSLDPNNNNNKPYNRNLSWYDHNKMFFQTSYTTNNSIAISGARDRIDFNISASDNRQNSTFRGNGYYSRSNLNSNLGFELFKNFKVRSITQLVYTRNTQLDPTGRTIMYAVNNGRPFANFQYQNPNGDYSVYLGDAVGVNHYNPFYEDQYADVKDNKVDIVQNFNANYHFPKFLELDVKYGLNYQHQELVYNIASQVNNLNADYWQVWAEQEFPRTNYGSPSAKEETGEIDHKQYKTLFQNLLTTATIRTDFENDFHLRIPLRTTTIVAYDYRRNDFNQYITYGLTAPIYTPYTASQMASYKIESDFSQPFLTYGYLALQRFEWGDIGGFSGGFRRDYSSAFGRAVTPQNFYRGDAYIRPSGFKFWKNTSLGNTFTDFKLRAAYGEAGIQPGAFDRYIVLQTRNLGNSVAFSFPTQNPNPNLNVEISKEIEVGTDMGFSVLKNGALLRNANLSFTYWKRSTDNTIWPVDAAPSSGTGTVLTNAFGLTSNGIQASLNLNVYSGKNLTWNFTTLFSKQSSKIKSIVGTEIPVTSAAGSTNYVLKAGEKIGQLYGYLMLHSVGETDANGNPYIAKADQSKYEVASNGWVVNSSTKQPYVTPLQYSFGDPNPKFNMSFNNEVTFKDFLTFSMQWDWVHGSHLYNQTKEWMYRDGIHGDYDNQITIGGQAGAWTAFYRGVYAQVSRNGTKNYFYEDASFTRLRNISVALDVAKLVRLPYFQRLQLVLAGRNLVTFTKYTGYDPEVSSGDTNSAFDRGVDHNTIPNLKSYQIGLNIGF